MTDEEWSRLWLLLDEEVMKNCGKIVREIVERHLCDRPPEPVPEPLPEPFVVETK